MTSTTNASTTDTSEQKGILNKFRRAYRWYKQHNPSSDTDSDESDEEDEGDDGRRRSSTANPAHGERKQSDEPSKPVIKSASTEPEFAKRFSNSSMKGEGYLKVPTSDPAASSFPNGDQPLDRDQKPKYAPIIYRRRSSIALTK